MDKKFQDFEKSIKGKKSFGFTPKYQDEFTIKIKPRIFVEIALKTFESLGWEVVFQDENQSEAKKKGEFNKWTHKINAKARHIGKVEVISESLASEIID